ncbi:CHASE2 domain-containing protein [Paraburkholderia lycopersici]|uniref:CHASE2 domain-containing protein n=1 Tax=Paraburkholderia lycopersici TaxID=416944 RepID=A0A1G6NTI7_9BURK|nr:CHASE2 domain-containing protein [Paraburkholderia lycopersici]SDC70921.1 CHASE2 domain-containing protein [Paraburkholderia lycopersici]
MNAWVRGACELKNRLAAALFNRTTLQGLLAIVFGIAAALVLPQLFGEEFATRKAASAYAPVAGQAYGNGSRDAISVMLIDDASLAQAGQTWPASYGYYARLLDALGSYKPRAVFFDIMFRDARPDPTLALFAQRLCALRAAGTRVFLAGTPDEAGVLRVRAGLDELRGRCFEPVAIGFRPDEIDKLAWTYPLEAPGGEGLARRSAALAIYDDLAKQPIADASAPMALSWGLSPAADGMRSLARHEPEEGGEAHNAHDAQTSRELYCRPDHGLLEIVPFGLRELLFHDAEKPVCVYHETVYAYDFANADDEGEALLERALTGRVVMIGTARAYSNDYVISPIHGRIPGVYLHAMALDNLYTYGSSYKHAAALALRADRDHLHLFMLVLGGLLAVVAVRSAKNRMRKEEKNERKPFEGLLPWVAGRAGESALWFLKCALEIGASLVLVAVLLYLGQSVLNMGFLSIVDIAVFALAAEWFEWNEKLVEWLLGPEKHEKAGEGEEARTQIAAEEKSQ